MSRLALYLLGPPRLERDGAPLELQYHKNIALLAYLAAVGPGLEGQTHTRESLVSLLWPKLEPCRARANLRRNLSLLRKALGGEWLLVDCKTIGLDSGVGAWVDVDRFRRLLQGCKAHGHPADDVCPDCLTALTEAVALYRGDFLEGFGLPDSAAFDEFQFFQTEGLRRELASALQRLVRGHSGQDDYETAIGYARRWLALDPLHEPAHRCLMELYAKAGQYTAALRQYRECMRILEEELNLPPAGETTALYERTRAERVRPSKKEIISHTSTRPYFIPPPLPAFLTEEEALVAIERPVFVAREWELARLNDHLDAALAGQGRVVFVTGGPGQGKTALMREFARRAMEAYPDLLVAGGNCNAYSSVGDPYLPFREVMGLLTGDVEARWAVGTITRDHARRLWAAAPLVFQALVDHGPFLIDTIILGAALISRAVAVASEGAGWLEPLRALNERKRGVANDLAQHALFEQITNVLRALAAQFPLLLLVDDIQWADAGSIGLLFHLGRRLEGSRILIAGAYRPEEVALGRNGERHPLESALGEFKRHFGDVWVKLRRADKIGGRRFVDELLDSESNQLGEDFRQGMFQHTGGHPLFTVELLRAMQERGELVQDEGGRWVEGVALDWERLPARVEAVIEERVSRLEERLREVLAVASVEGEWFTAQVIAYVQDVPEREMLRTLSQDLGARHRLVQEGEEIQVGDHFLSRYQFAHTLFQVYLYNGLSSGERRLLHGEIATALEALYGDQAETIVAQLAHHYDAAGRVEKAVEHLLRAGDQARLAYANEEAVAYFNRALELLDDARLAPSHREWRLEALKGLGRAYFWAQELAGAEKCLREAITLGREMGLAPRELVRLYFWLGLAVGWQGRYDDRIRIGEEGLALLGDDATLTEAVAWADAVESVEAALINQIIAFGCRWKGDRKRWKEFTYRTARFIQRLPYSEELIPAYTHIVQVYGEDRDAEGAIKWLRILEGKAIAHHDLRALAETHSYAGYTLAQMGDLREAISRSQQALKLSTRIGDAWLESRCLWSMGDNFLSLGNLQKAEEYTDRGLEATKVVGNKHDITFFYFLIGQIFLCQGDWERAANALERSLQFCREISWPDGWPLYLLGQVYLAQGDRVEALKRFQEAVALQRAEESRGYILPPRSTPNPSIASVLSGLEAAYADPTAFRAFCRRLREEQAKVDTSLFVQWFLESAVVGAVREPPLQRDEFTASLSFGWDWKDPFEDCSFAVQDGLEIRTANGRDLWHINLSAPRVLRSASGDLTVQTVCAPVSSEKPAIGGLLLWKDKENYLRLDRGAMGEHDIYFGGCLSNQDVTIGRGRLESVNRQVSAFSQGGSPGQVYLRLERVGKRVDALCSGDGERWFTLGHVPFPVEDPLQIGLHAIGNIDRTIYRGAYPDGAAIRFESFKLWGA